jgi:hypothetical protein
MTPTVIIDESYRRLEIENAVNRCHRRCRIVNVRRKAVEPFGWPSLFNLWPAGERKCISHARMRL